MSLSNGRDWLNTNLVKVDDVWQTTLDILSKSSLSPLFVAAGHVLPKIKRALAYIIVETVAIPRIVMYQLIAVCVLRTGLIMVSTAQGAWSWFTTTFTEHGRIRKRLKDKLQQSKTYEEWCENAKECDMHDGAHLWRYEDECDRYDEQGLRQRCELIERLLEKGDIFNLMFKLRGGLSRTKFGVLRDGLFNKALSGTKAQIERYNETVVRALNAICDAPTPNKWWEEAALKDGEEGVGDRKENLNENETIPTDVKLAFFNEMRHAYGRTAFMMSGGASLGYYHVGLIGALLDQGLLPRVISGSSAGSIMAAIIGTRSDEELQHVIRTGNGLKLDLVKPADKTLKSFAFRYFSGTYYPGGIFKYYWRKLPMDRDYSDEDHDEGLYPPGIGVFMYGLFRYPYFPALGFTCDSEHLEKRIRENCGGDLTFQEAFERTGRIVNITVAPHNRTDPPRLLNYLTAPHILVRSAALASSAVPGVYKPQPLLVKTLDGKIKELPGLYSDGSLENDLPSQQLSELFNINHFIVSQVNPHGVALSSLNNSVGVLESGETMSSDLNMLHKGLSALMGFLQSQLRAWGVGLLNLISLRQGMSSWELSRIQLKGVTSVFTQTYEGRSGHDISILPWHGGLSLLSAVAHIIDSPSKKDFLQTVKVGKSNAWPKIGRILIHCKVEATLESCVQKIRFQLAKETMEQMQQEEKLFNELMDEEEETNGSAKNASSSSSATAVMVSSRSGDGASKEEEKKKYMNQSRVISAANSKSLPPFLSKMAKSKSMLEREKQVQKRQSFREEDIMSNDSGAEDEDGDDFDIGKGIEQDDDEGGESRISESAVMLQQEEHIYDDGSGDDFYIEEGNEDDEMLEDDVSYSKTLAQLSGFSVMDRTVQPPQQVLTTSSGKPITPVRQMRRKSMTNTSGSRRLHSSSSSAKPAGGTRARSSSDTALYDDEGGEYRPQTSRKAASFQERASGSSHRWNDASLGGRSSSSLSMRESEVNEDGMEDFRPVLRKSSSSSERINSKQRAVQHAKIHHQYHPSHQLLDANNSSLTPSAASASNMIKSTSMSSFYYKKGGGSKSSEKLNELNSTGNLRGKR